MLILRKENRTWLRALVLVLALLLLAGVAAAWHWLDRIPRKPPANALLVARPERGANNATGGWDATRRLEQGLPGVVRGSGSASTARLAGPGARSASGSFWTAQGGEVRLP